MPVPFGSFFLPHSDFSATSFSTAVIRSRRSVAALRRRVGRVREHVELELQRVLPGRERQLVEEDWNTNEKALLPGARSAPTGTPSAPTIESPNS